MTEQARRGLSAQESVSLDRGSAASPSPAPVCIGACREARAAHAACRDSWAAHTARQAHLCMRMLPATRAAVAGLDAGGQHVQWMEQCLQPLVPSKPIPALACTIETSAAWVGCRDVAVTMAGQTSAAVTYAISSDGTSCSGHSLLASAGGVLVAAAHRACVATRCVTHIACTVRLTASGAFLRPQ